MYRSASVAVVLTAILVTAGRAPAQDADEVARLKREVELLKKENELLKKEVELLKKEAKAKPDGAGGPKAGARSLAELLPEGAVLKGTFRATQGGGHGEITVTISERDGNKFKATSVLRQMKDNKEVGTADVDIEGVIDGARLSWKSVGTANKGNASLTLKGEGLEGTYKTQAGISGTIGLKVAK